MFLHKLGGKHIASAAAVLILAGSSAALAAGPASATDYNVSTWNATSCGNDGYYLCLWYRDAGQGQGGAGWGTRGNVSNLSGQNFFLAGSPNNDGLGQAVRNNAGEISNGTINCTDYTFYSPNYAGDGDYVYAGMGGNLTSGLHNNEASVELFCN